jgi:hypothetical protein
MSASKRRFTIEQQSDPVEFWSWLLNTLHMDLTGGRLQERACRKGPAGKACREGLGAWTTLEFGCARCTVQGAGYK